MSANVIKDAKLYLGSRNLTADIMAVAVNYSSEILDKTTLGDETRNKVGGLKGVTCNAEMLFNSATSEGYMFDRINAAGEPVTIGANSGVAGAVAYLFKAAVASYGPGASVGELLKLSFDAEASDSDLVRGNILHVAAGAVASGSSTPQNLGAISSVQQLYATLHAIAASAGDTLDIVIESDTLVGFTSPVTRATFTQIAGGVTAGEWLTPVAGPITDTWWRISWTIAGASPSFDFIVTMGIQE